MGQADVLDGAAAEGYRLEGAAIAAGRSGQLVVSLGVWSATGTNPHSVVAAYDAARARWNLLGSSVATGLNSRWAAAASTSFSLGNGLALLPGGGPVIAAHDTRSLDPTVLRYAAATDSWEPLGRPRLTELLPGSTTGSNSQLAAGLERLFLVLEAGPQSQPALDLAVRWNWHQACPPGSRP